MQQLDDMAATILAAAVASGVDVERSYIAPGPDFARDCRAIVVHLDLLPIVPLPGSEFAGGCAFVAQPEWKVTFVADCVPAVDDQGRPPTAAAITAWSSAFLADVGAIHEALSALVAGETGAPWAGDCSSVQLGQGAPTGQSPYGGAATFSWPLSVLDLGYDPGS